MQQWSYMVSCHTSPSCTKEYYFKLFILLHTEIVIETLASEYDISVSWNNPFTTDLSFCVDVRSVESSETVVSECVSGTSYVFTSLNSNLCEDLSFTVTPTVTDEGVQKNGTSSNPVVGYFRGRRGSIYNYYGKLVCIWEVGLGLIWHAFIIYLILALKLCVAR